MTSKWGARASTSRFAERAFQVLCSLKLAVVVLLLLTLALIVATVLESAYDTPTAQYWVYRAAWFRGLLGLLGVEIFAVAMSRLPWKPRHVPFLLAHLGILLLLIGAWITDRFGLDGSLRVTEGETTSRVEINEPTLVLSEGERVRAVRVPWTPPNATFRPIRLPEYGLEVDRFLAHADAEVSFEAAGEDSGVALPALRFKMEGGPMRIVQDFWLWAGDASTRSLRAGPARFAIEAQGLPLAAGPASRAPGPEDSGPALTFRMSPDGSLSYESRSSQGAARKGKLGARNEVVGRAFDPGWKGNIRITLLEWIPNARARTTYKPSRVQYGDRAPPAAIHVVARSPSGTKTEDELWLGLGERAFLTTGGRSIGLSFVPKQVMLPFSVRLERFQIDHYAGTKDPMEYSSRVTVLEGGREPVQQLISMNEPLERRGVTLYQASYENAEPRPVTSILSVNRDPGRWMKYLGSILLVAGTISLFAMKYRRKKLAERAARQAPGAVLRGGAGGVA